MIGKEDGKIPEAITRYIVALYWQSPLLQFESSAFVFFPNDKGPTEGSEISRKPVRNRPNATSLSLPCLFPHPLTRTSTPTPIPISTTATATATASAAGTTVPATPLPLLDTRAWQVSDRFLTGFWLISDPSVELLSSGEKQRQKFLGVVVVAALQW